MLVIRFCRWQRWLASEAFWRRRVRRLRAWSAEQATNGDRRGARVIADLVASPARPLASGVATGGRPFLRSGCLHP